MVDLRLTSLGMTSLVDVLTAAPLMIVRCRQQPHSHTKQYPIIAALSRCVKGGAPAAAQHSAAAAVFQFGHMSRRLHPMLIVCTRCTSTSAKRARGHPTFRKHTHSHTPDRRTTLKCRRTCKITMHWFCDEQCTSAHVKLKAAALGLSCCEMALHSLLSCHRQIHTVAKRQMHSDSLLVTMRH